MKSKDHKYIILFDGVCNFCNSSVNFIIDHDSKRRFVFASLQSKYAQKLLKKHHILFSSPNSIVLFDKEKYYFKSEAALKIAGKLDGLWPAFSAFQILPKSFLDFLYDLVAQNRYRIFGKSDSCRLPDSALKERFLG
ncbi:thiol-disulfide oxidoreductase DCC family protein [Xanthovirga aplysinae]|uniref:thiol-disulfide oxidoreductase DCC family protein n=1 Tax=Xanthovirga aplysinae TaxID=2529853 RepID=UPI0012BC9BEE|nr:DCC1-like thiol-disulfide oxidoreductase family protein [Xanthovirga aplysinae]MTI31707.1 DUF393 domain-containing protein [Xanthovirga aplysinae]